MLATHPQRRSLLMLLLLLVVGLIGCGESPPQRVPISGSVKLNGQPVETGSIMFVPLGQDVANPSAGGPIQGGEYSLATENGPAAGNYRVEIRWPRPTGKKVPLGSPAPPGTMVDEVREAIPAKYNSQSTLEREVSSGENTMDFDLQ